MKLRKALYVVTLFAFILPQLAMADGMVMPPPKYWVQETGQKAAIFYDGGVETMVVSITFQGDAEDFGWIIPAPSKPTITKGSDELFTSLEELTGTYYSYDDGRYDVIGLGAETKQNAVTIIETKQIEYYEVTTLAATDKDALTVWLNDNGYSYPTSASYILDSYINNGWYFVAMKIDTESLEWSNVSAQLKNGHAVPVAISFETENVVYPLKISSVTSKPGDEEAEVSYNTGRIDKGFDVGNNDKLTFDDDTVISPDEGTLEMWVKPEWLDSKKGTFDLLNVSNETTSMISYEFQMYRNYTDNLYQYRFRSYLGTSHDTWSSAKFDINRNQWNHFATTWKEGEKPKFYLNGNTIELDAASSPEYRGNFSMLEPVDADTYIGSGLFNLSFQAIFDEVAVSSIAKLADEILADYNMGISGEEMSVNSTTTFLAHFNSSLSDEVSQSELDYVVKKDPSFDIYYSETTPIVLYVFDSNKKELPNFTTEYAGWIKKGEIEKLALNDQGYPWVQPSQGKFFLTKLTRTMAYTDMTEDLFFRDADNNSTVNAAVGTEDSDRKVIFYVVIAIGVVGTLVMLVVLNTQSKPKK
jgi:hypothetical protein